jgi:hypothetical protein
MDARGTGRLIRLGILKELALSKSFLELVIILYALFKLQRQPGSF